MFVVEFSNEGILDMRSLRLSLRCFDRFTLKNLKKVIFETEQKLVELPFKIDSYEREMLFKPRI